MQAIDWHRIDWTKRDAEIGREVNRSRERIRQMRAKLRKPHPIHRKLSDKGIAIRQWFLDNADKSGTLTVRELAEAINASQATAYTLAKRFMFQIARGHKRDPRFALIDWRLPHVDIAKIWRLKNPPSQRSSYAACRVRSLYGYPAPRWDARCNDTDLATNRAYRNAYAAEVEKAETYFEEVGQ